jgi:hypothetical protein
MEWPCEESLFGDAVCYCSFLCPFSTQHPWEPDSISCSEPTRRRNASTPSAAWRFGWGAPLAETLTWKSRLTSAHPCSGENRGSTKWHHPRPRGGVSSMHIFLLSWHRWKHWRTCRLIESRELRCELRGKKEGASGLQELEGGVVI